jgi:hypothetical protein
MLKAIGLPQLAQQQELLFCVLVVDCSGMLIVRERLIECSAQRMLPFHCMVLLCISF